MTKVSDQNDQKHDPNGQTSRVVMSKSHKSADFTAKKNAQRVDAKTTWVLTMANWYTADPHFMHENVISFCDRPFKSVDEMDAVLLENMQAVVKPEDELWIVGDFAFGPKAKDEAELTKIFEQLPGAKKHLVVGNHDLAPTLVLPWDSVHQLAELRDGPHRQAHTLCHYPMITWNHARRQALHMFGHVHNNWLGSRNAVNVGVDVWDFMPVSFEQVAERASELPPNKHFVDVEPGVDGR